MSLRLLFVSFVCFVGAARSAPEFPAFPKPEPEKTFADLKILQPDGGVYRTPVDDWDGARRRVAEDARWAEWVTKKRAEVDAWMARHHDRTEWVGGRPHNFVSPKDGASLVWTEDIPGEEAPYLMSTTGHRVKVTPRIFGAWVDSFRKKHMDMTTEAARLFRLTGEARYADWAAGELDFYAENLTKWPLSTPPTPGREGRLSIMSFNDAVMLVRLLETARLVFDQVTPERRQRWFDQLFKPEVDLLERATKNIHNMTVWERSTQAMVALLYRDEAIWRQAMEGEYGLRDLLRRGVTSDYLWCEQTIGYTSFVIGGVQPLLIFAGLLGQGDRIREEAAIVQNMMLVPSTIRFPDGTVPNPADSTTIPRAPSARARQLYRILPTPLGLAQAQGLYLWDTLVDPPAGVSSRVSAALPEVVSRNLESTRFALMKKGPWQVFFHYGQLVRTHSQAEALNWSASFDGVTVSRDPGTVRYGSPLHLGYYVRGLNHNVPLVDGEGQRPWKPGELLRFDAAAAVMSAAQPDYRDGAAARRTLRIEGDALIDEAAVTLPAGAKPDTRLGLALHLQGKPRLPAAFAAVSGDVFAQGRPEPFKHWQDVRAATFRDRAEIEVAFDGGRVLAVRFETPGEFTLYQGSSPDLPPARRAGFYLEVPPGAKAATFTTTLQPARQGN